MTTCGATIRMRIVSHPRSPRDRQRLHCSWVGHRDYVLPQTAMQTGIRSKVGRRPKALPVIGFFPNQTTLMITSMLPRVAFEYGHVS